MKFIINTFGSAGDVHPFMALALQLQQRGHEVVIFTSAKFFNTITKAGIRCEPLGTEEDFNRLLSDPRLWDADRSLEMVLESMAPALPVTLEALRKEIQTSPKDTVLIGSTLAFPVRILRDQLSLPLASVHLAPAIFWSAYDPPMLNPKIWFLKHLPPFGVRLFFKLIGTVVRHKFAKPINKTFKEIGYPPVRNIFGEWIHSPDLTVGMFPDWFGVPQRDWPAHLFLGGFPLFREEHEPEMAPELTEFLAAGAPPVAFTPGSANIQGADFFRESAAACQKLGCRGVFVTPAVESIPADLPETILHVRYIPFARLFSKCAAVVHHGGIGTTAQCFAAGVPQLVMPWGHDQFDNGHRVKRLGVGRVLAAKKYKGEAVVRELNPLLKDSAYKSAAMVYKEKLAAKGTDWDGLIDRLVGLGKK